jgi:uncharacterized membrane protein
VPEVLNFGDILSYSFRWGFGQYFRILLMLLLWVVTIWIPYLNVGTTIAVTTGAPILLSRQQRIDPTFIFDRRYRELMAEWLLLVLLIGLGVFAGLVFVIIPGIVLSLGWILAPLLLVDRGVGVLDSLRQSWRATLGEKWTLLFGWLAVYLLYIIPAGVIAAILGALLPEGAAAILMGLYGVLAYAGLMAVELGYTGYVYAVLSKRAA